MIINKMVERENLPDIVAGELREAIISGEIQPGTRLKQKEIADAFKTSLIPVREAFRTLEKEGLLKLNTNKGAIVSVLSAEEARQIFELRLVLELGAIELSFENLDVTDLTEATNLYEAMNTETDPAKLSEINQQFHACFYHACNNPMLIDLIKQHYLNIDRYMRLYLYNHRNSDFSQKYHKMILDAVEMHDISKVKQLITEHMNTAKEDLINQINLKGV